MFAAKAISLLIGYVCGLFLAGYLLGKLNNVDIRQEGSGNVGTTNTARVLGAKSGIVTLICDVMKGLAASMFVWMIFHETHGNDLRLLMSYATFGAMLGHMFPCYMGFKGGKGVATSLSFLLVCVPQTLPICVLTFLVLVLLTKYVSLGSVVGTLTVVAQMFFFGSKGLLYYDGSRLKEVYVLVCIAAAIVVFKHRGNIVRLLHHEENKLSFGGK